MTTGVAASACIGFDAVRALRNSTGLGNYARGVLSGLHQVAPDIEQHLYSPRPARAAYASLPSELHAHLHLPPDALQRPFLREYWRTFRLGAAANRDGIALYHGLTQEIPRDLPATGIPSVVTAADLLYFTHPELFPAIDRASYRWRYRWSMQHADAIVAISSWTKQQLQQHFAIPAHRIVVVPPARDPRFVIPCTTEERRAAQQRARTPDRYMVAVGTLEPRKNQQLALAAMAELNPALPPLVLIGRDGGSAALLHREISRLGLTERVHMISDVAYSDLPALVQGASLALYLSSAEGFGMPIVEAMSAGVPVVAAKGAHLRDAGGAAAKYVDPNDPVALAAAITEVLQPGAAEATILLGREHAMQFDQATLARRLLTVYDAVIGGAPLPYTTMDAMPPFLPEGPT